MIDEAEQAIKRLYALVDYWYEPDDPDEPVMVRMQDLDAVLREVRRLRAENAELRRALDGTKGEK